MAGGADQDRKGTTVPIPRYVLDELMYHIKTFAGGKESPLFTSTDGGHLRPGNWRKRVWYSACERARARGALDPKKPIPHVHDLRHTAAILAMDDGVPPKVIQDILGHASFKMTMDLYAARASEELMDQAAEAMDSAHRKRTGEKGWESANLVQSGQEELEQG